MSKHKSYQFKVKTFDIQTGEIEGYANTFNFKDYAGDITMPGAFTETLKEHKRNGTVIKMLWQHDPTKPIGVWTEASEDEKGLYLKGKLTLGVQLADEAALLMAAGALDGLSIGYEVINEKYDYKEDANLLLELSLQETSIVTFPCNAQSRIESVKSKITPRELEKQLRIMGLSQKTAKAFVAKGFKAIDASEDEQAEVTTTEDVLEIIEAIVEAIPEYVLEDISPEDVQEIFEEALEEIVDDEKRKARKQRKARKGNKDEQEDTVLEEIMEILAIAEDSKNSARKETLNTDTEDDGMSDSPSPEDEDFLKSLQGLLSAKSKTGRSKLKTKIKNAKATAMMAKAKK